MFFRVLPFYQVNLHDISPLQVISGYIRCFDSFRPRLTVTQPLQGLPVSAPRPKALVGCSGDSILIGWESVKNIKHVSRCIKSQKISREFTYFFQSSWFLCQFRSVVSVTAFCILDVFGTTEEATLQAGDVLYVSLGCICKSSMRKCGP